MKETKQREVVVVAYGRSAIAKAPKGRLRTSRPETVAAEVVKGIFEKTKGLSSKQIDEVIFGCAFPEAEQGLNVARIISLLAKIPYEASAQTVNRFCASGLQAVATGANAILAGEYQAVLAGGVEFMSAVPMGGTVLAANPDVFAVAPEAYVSMGITAEHVARAYNITREEQDAFSVASHQKAAQARRNGKFKEQIIPIPLPNLTDSQPSFFMEDEGIREQSSIESLAKLKPVFRLGGSVTAGNSSQTSDGVAALVLMERSYAESQGIKPLARFVGFASAGVDPKLMGIGPIVAIPKVLKQTGLTLDQIDLIELNEAFASQAIACIRHLKLNPEIVNVNGGAIAMGHPLGCTGALLSIKLLEEMKARKQKYGLVSMCVGGGMGCAAVYETINE